MDMDRSTIKVRKLSETGNDSSYWRSRPPQERLTTLEEIRREFHDWPDEDTADEDRPRLQRVYRVRKRQ